MRFAATLLALFVAAVIAVAAAEYKNEVLRGHPQFTHPPHIKTPQPHTYLSAADIPKNFDWRNVDGVNYISRTLNQHLPVYCGSCWAHGSSSSVVDRLKIMRKNAYPEYSVHIQDVLNCGRSTAGSCQGGTTEGMFNYMKENGLPIESCGAYEARNGECTAERKCGDCSGSSCWAIKDYASVYVDEWGPLNSVEEIKAEMYARGPVAIGINAIPLLNITQAEPYVIDNCNEEDKFVNHVVELIGWEYNQDYESDVWIIRNSWGQNSGENGVIRVIAGENCLGTEEYAFFAVPKLL